MKLHNEIGTDCYQPLGRNKKLDKLEAHVKKVCNRNRRRGKMPRPQLYSFTIIALRFYMSQTVIRRRHRNRDDFFEIWEVHRSMDELDKVSSIIKIMLGSIAGFSLLVGGIGIMNMMLVSVTERTREIGLRKAVGAKRREILLQFLIEAVFMCGVGGLLGIGLGIFAGQGMANIAVKVVKIVPEWPAVLSVQWMVISVAFSAVIGIVFGVYPAVKAARLSPIEALRAE